MLQAFAGEVPVHPVALDETYDLKWVYKTHDGFLHAWVAVVCGRPFDGKPVRVNLKEWKDGIELSRLGGKPFYVVVEWDGELFHVRHDEVMDLIYYGFSSRTDHDLQDIDPCVCIPAHLFRDHNGKSH